MSEHARVVNRVTVFTSVEATNYFSCRKQHYMHVKPQHVCRPFQTKYAYWLMVLVLYRHILPALLDQDYPYLIWLTCELDVDLSLSVLIWLLRSLTSWHHMVVGFPVTPGLHWGLTLMSAWGQHCLLVHQVYSDYWCMLRDCTLAFLFNECHWSWWLFPEMSLYWWHFYNVT